jgi:NADPH:quinone reductase-like Zn-dependent oxidoreductase
MKAVYLTASTGPEGLVLGELPESKPGASEVLINVHAAAITPMELQRFPTSKGPSGERRPFPIVLSHEFSGVSADVESGVAISKSAMRFLLGGMRGRIVLQVSTP